MGGGGGGGAVRLSPLRTESEICAILNLRDSCKNGVIECIG